MKLIRCGECGDIFNLRGYAKFCTCRASVGLYTDERNITITDAAIPLGILNKEFGVAMQSIFEKGRGNSFPAFVISKKDKYVHVVDRSYFRD